MFYTVYFLMFCPNADTFHALKDSTKCEIITEQGKPLALSLLD